MLHLEKLQAFVVIHKKSNRNQSYEIVYQGLGLAIGATLLDIKKATTLASVTVMTFMLAGGFFVKVSIRFQT